MNYGIEGAMTAGYLPAEVLRGFVLHSILVVPQGAVECGHSQANQLGSHLLVPKFVPMLLSAKVGIGSDDVSKDQCGGLTYRKPLDFIRTVWEICPFPNPRVIIQPSGNLL
jgi:hypothetical protein